MGKCLNCSEEFSGNYCSNCGQMEIEGRMTIKMVLVDFIEAVFLFDSSLYKTLKGLLFKPDELVKNFLSGKRKTYFPPLKFFLLFMTIYLLVLNYFGEDIFKFLGSGFQHESIHINKIELLKTLVEKNLNVLYFILTPIIAFFIHVFYRKIQFNYAEILIFSFYIMGIGVFLSTIIVLFSLIETKLFAFKALVTFGYFPYAIIRFTNSKSFMGLLKSFLTILMSYIVFVCIVFILVILYLFVFII